jgi:hypothetical protein
MFKPATVRESRPNFFAEPPPEVKALIKLTASDDPVIRSQAMLQFAKASLELPLKKGIMAGNIADGIFAPWPVPPGTAPELPLDIIAPGTEKNYTAYVMPYHGYIPQRTTEGDYVMVPTFEVANAIDWPLRLVRDGRWDIPGRCFEVFEAGFIKKHNDDAWHTLLMAAAARGIIVKDPAAAGGRFSLSLVNRMGQTMRRLAGGNTTSVIRGRLTDLYMSIECFQDMRSWTWAEVPESVRSEIYSTTDGGLSEIYGVRLHDLYELGNGQEYQNWALSNLNFSLPSGCT